jgi:DUF971 family protein
MSDLREPVTYLLPDSIILSADRNWLHAAWADGRRADLAASRLRSACRCGFCTRARADGTPLCGDGVTILAVEPCGPRVGRLIFSDGHDHGLYPWGYLLEIAATQEAERGRV